MRRPVNRSFRVAVLGLGLVAACQNMATSRRLANYEARARQDDAKLSGLESRVEAFDRSVDELTALHQNAAREFEAASRDYAQAGEAADSARVSYEAATDAYESAARNWRLVTIAILAAAASDMAGHLCSTRMTTAQYRRKLRADGVDLSDLDADHGLPRSWGGADHPLNYRMIESSLNRSLGNDVMRKLMVHPTHLLQGAVVSGLMRLRCSPQL